MAPSTLQQVPVKPGGAGFTKLLVGTGTWGPSGLLKETNYPWEPQALLPGLPGSLSSCSSPRLLTPARCLPQQSWGLVHRPQHLESSAPGAH